MTLRPTVDLAASCACGAVTVRYRGIVYGMLLCSCEDCQRATGSGHSSVILGEAASATIKGATKSFDRPANSGAVFTRSFCPECGTPIAGQSSRAEGMVMLPAGLFGAATAGWFKPNQLIFARSHREWDSIAAELPRHATYRGES